MSALNSILLHRPVMVQKKLCCFPFALWMRRGGGWGRKCSAQLQANVSLHTPQCCPAIHMVGYDCGGRGERQHSAPLKANPVGQTSNFKMFRCSRNKCFQQALVLLFPEIQQIHGFTEICQRKKILTFSLWILAVKVLNKLDQISPINSKLQKD